MPQRCSVLHGIGIGDQGGCQVRVFCNPLRPKSEPKSATIWVCDFRNNLLPGWRASHSHLPLIGLICHKGVLSSLVVESGTRVAVKRGCFAIQRDPNLSPNQQLSEGADDTRCFTTWVLTWSTFYWKVNLHDTWPEGSLLPLAVFLTTFVSFFWYDFITIR